MGYQTDKPHEDSQFRLLRCCSCHSEDVVYIQASTGGRQQYRVRCRFCGQRTPWYSCKHDAQGDWNGRFIPNLAKWLSQRLFEVAPPAAEKPTFVDGKRALDEDEVAAIRRMFEG